VNIRRSADEGERIRRGHAEAERIEVGVHLGDQAGYRSARIPRRIEHRRVGAATLIADRQKNDAARVCRHQRAGVVRRVLEQGVADPTSEG
jgi:hypothetical protein